MRKTGALFLVLLLAGVAANCAKEGSGPAEASKKALSGSSEATVLERAGNDPAELQAGPAVAAKPHIVFEQKEYDFGKVDEGQKVEKSFKFRNKGEGTLVIRSVRSG
jgi:hypothetical protein